MSPGTTTRIGGVPYGVGAPLLQGLDVEPGVELRRDVPSALIAQLRDGRLDAALVSSVEGFRRPGYRAVPGIGICCDGPVRSVRAFRRRDAEITTVAVDDASETSVALLRILLRERLGVTRCAFERVASTRQPDRLAHDLVLLIGDDGLHAEAGDREVIDLGEAWRNWTGMPFVFALWLIAPGADAERATALLHRAHARARSRRGPRGEGVYYELGAAELCGLERFRTEAVRAGVAEPDIWPTWTVLGGTDADGLQRTGVT